jgi:iron complex outermembrane receptor protein
MSIHYWLLSSAILALDPSYLPVDSVQHVHLLHTDSITIDSIKLKHVHLDEVYIGQRVEKTDQLQHTGQKVHVLHASTLRSQVRGSFAQTLAQLPGVQAVSIGSGAGKPMIRGLGFNRILVQVAGTRHEGQQWGSDHGLEIDQWGVGEVVLLKGPASLQLGADAIGGAVWIEPNLIPTDRNVWGEATLFGRSNNGQHGGSVRTGSKLGPWAIDVRATALRYMDYKVPVKQINIYDYKVDLPQGRLRNTAGEEISGQVQLFYQKQDNFSNRTYFSWNHQSSGFFANAHGLEPRRVDSDLHDRSFWDKQYPQQSVHHFLASNRSIWKLPAHQWRLDVAFQHNDRAETNRYTPHGFMPNQLLSDMDPHLERGFRKNTASIHLVDRWLLDNQQWTFGIQSNFQQQERDGWTFLVPAYTQWQAGIYALHELRLQESWVLETGVRVEYNDLSTEKYEDWFVSGQGMDATKVIRSQALRKQSPVWVASIGSNYQWDKVSLDLHAGKSFRMPLAHELASNGVNYHYFQYHEGNPDLDPETAYQIEAGIKVKDSRWNVEIRPYAQWFANYIYLNPTPDFDYLQGAGNQKYIYSQSKVQRWGGEWIAQMQLTERLQLEWSGAFVQSKQRSGSKRGYGLPFSPPLTSLSKMSYSYPSINHQHPVTMAIDWRFVDAQNQVVPPEKKTPGYHLFGVQMQVPLQLLQKKVNIGLQVNNLLNKRYLNHTSFYRLIDLPEAGIDASLTFHIQF